MAMIRCPECKNRVSDKAHECPNCGYVLKEPTRGIFGNLFKGLFILFNLIMAFSMWSGVSRTAEIVGADSSGAAGVGAGIGVSIIMFLWVLGDIILGALVFFTKPKR